MRNDSDCVIVLMEALAARTAQDSVCDVIPAMGAAGRKPGKGADLVDRREAYTLIVGAVPFSGSVDTRRLPADLRLLARSRRADVTAAQWSLLALQGGGRAVLLVPEDMLFATTAAHRALRRRLLEENVLQAVIRLAPGWYKPRTGAAVLAFRKGGSTQDVWFCDVTRRPQRAPAGREGSKAAIDVSDLVSRWHERSVTPRDDTGGGSSFRVTRAQIEASAFDLAIERYRALEPSAPAAPRVHEILTEITEREAEIFQGIRDLVGMLK